MKNVFILFFVFIGTSLLAQEQEEMIYDTPTTMPVFPGGGSALDQFIKTNLVYPESAKANNVQGKVYVQFVVEKDGSISNIEVRRAAKDESLNKEALRVIKLMPNWEPGKNRGKIVRTRYTVPVVFTI